MNNNHRHGAPSLPPSESSAQTESYWPDLRPSLRTATDLQRLRLDCVICTSDSTSVDIMVLTCGHILCRECVARIIRGRDGPADNPHAQRRECPFCKTELGRKRNCRQQCPRDNSWTFGQRVPRTMDELRAFPLTLPEGGGRPEACADCREHRVMEALVKLCQELLNANGRSSSFQVHGAHQSAADEARVEEENGRNGMKRVPELQGIVDSTMALIYDADFTRQYTGIAPPAAEPHRPHRGHGLRRG